MPSPLQREASDVRICDACGSPAGSFLSLEDRILAAPLEEQQRIFARLAANFSI